MGVHCHIGSQIFDLDPFEEAAKVMLEFIAQVKNELNYESKDLISVAGLEFKYLNEHDPAPFETYMERVSEVVKNECEKLGIAQPFIYIEPGRSIAAPAGITIYKVGARRRFQISELMYRLTEVWLTVRDISFINLNTKLLLQTKQMKSAARE